MRGPEEPVYPLQVMDSSALYGAFCRSALFLEQYPRLYKASCLLSASPVPPAPAILADGQRVLERPILLVRPLQVEQVGQGKPFEMALVDLQSAYKKLACLSLSDIYKGQVSLDAHISYIFASTRSRCCPR